MSEVLQPFLPITQEHIDEAGRYTPESVKSNTFSQLFDVTGEPLPTATTTPISYLEPARSPEAQSAKEYNAPAPEGLTKGYGALPHIIAILAAGKGNFGPLFTISEQSRKTQLFKDIRPHVVKATNLSYAGDYKAAQKIIDDLILGVGDRSPEIVQFLQGAQDKIYKKNQAHQELRTFNTALESFINTGEYGSDPKKDPRYEVLQLTKELERNHSPLSEEMRKTLSDAIKLNITTTRGVATATSPVSGRTAVTSTETVPEPQDISQEVMQLIQKDYPGIRPNDVYNALSGKPTPYVIPDGKFKGAVIDLSSKENIGLLRKDLSDAAGFTAEAKIAANVNVPPEANLHAMKYSASLRDLATRRAFSQPAPQGGTEPTLAGDVLKSEVEQRKAINIASIKATEENDRAKIYDLGFLPVHFDSNNTNDFLQVHDDILTLGEARQYKDSVKLLRKEVYNDEVRPLWQAYKGLHYAAKALDELGNPENIKERVSTGVSEYIGRYLGYYDDANASAAGAKAVVDRAIEMLGRSQKYRDSAYIGALKSITVGPFAAARQGKKAARDVALRLKDELEDIVGRGKIPPFGSVELDGGKSNETVTITPDVGQLVDVKLPDGTVIPVTVEEKRKIDMALGRNTVPTPSGSQGKVGKGQQIPKAQFQNSRSKGRK